jgi:hypothetical protein
MRKIAMRLTAIVVSLGLVSAAYAQGYALVVIEHPFRAQDLAGAVVDPTGAPVEGVVVEDCDASFMHVLASTQTDEKGRFRFPKAKSGSTHFLRLEVHGFDPMHVTVLIRRLARTKLCIRLTIAN